MRLFESIKTAEYGTVYKDTGEQFESQDKFFSLINTPEKAAPYAGKTFIMVGQAGGEPFRVKETKQYTIEKLFTEPVELKLTGTE